MIKTVLANLKRLTVSAGLYRPARWMARRLRPETLRAHQDDVALVRSLVSGGALCFDIGANIGEKSEAMLDAGAKVVAFEPNPRVLPELHARCAHRRDWTCVAAALGSGAGIATLHARVFHSQSSLSAEWDGAVAATYDVPVITLDAAIARYGMPAYCKIDVEGWELEVFRGLSQAMPLLSFEFHLDDRGIAKTRACLARLATLGPATVNLTPAERSQWHLAEWMPLAAFAEWFPGDLASTLPGKLYGDIYVRTPAR